MSVISVRIDSEVDNLLTKLSIQRGVSKSDMVRILIGNGLEKETPNLTVLDELLETAKHNQEFLLKNFKVTAQVLALALGVMNHINPDEIKTAKANAKQYLERHGVEA